MARSLRAEAVSDQDTEVLLIQPGLLDLNIVPLVLSVLGLLFCYEDVNLVNS